MNSNRSGSTYTAPPFSFAKLFSKIKLELPFTNSNVDQRRAIAPPFAAELLKNLLVAFSMENFEI